MPYNKIDGLKLKVFPLKERKSYIDIKTAAVCPDDPPPAVEPRLAEQIERLVERIKQARENGASVMLAYGAHLIKNGGGPLVNALIEGGFVSHVATQGAGIIHDWEFAFQGCSSESVRDNAPVGRFGSWDETGRSINLAALTGAAEGLGFGEAIGRFIAEDGITLPSTDELQRQIVETPGHPLTAARADLFKVMMDFDLGSGRMNVEHPHKQYSVPATAYKHRVPFTVHPGIGYDIYTNHPMFHGGAIGRAAATDARIFANSVLNLTNGVYMSIGCAIMSPQVFEKAFSAANNLRQQKGEKFIKDHYIAINDIAAGGDWDWLQGEPPKEHPAYYLRFCKTFYRMGGTVDYLCADNRAVLSNLISNLKI